MLVLDNFFPSELINSVVFKAKKYAWEFARSDKNDDFYWTAPVYGDNYIETDTNFLSKFKHEEINTCWEYIKNKFSPIVTDDNLESCYLNGLTYGIEAHAHIDSEHEENFVTVICYVCDSWNSHWGGETCFYNMNYSNNPADEVYYTHEITKSVLPKHNRVVIFNGNIVHSVRPLSKTFKGLRKTLMFKLNGVSIKDLEYKCS